MTVTDDALRRLIREYTEESGVRNLEREIGALCRKVGAHSRRRRPAGSRSRSMRRRSSDYLGVPRYEFGLAEEQDEVGVATGAAVTSVGGDLLAIEVTIMEGKGDLILTGQLGDVMQESARAAISYARARTRRLRVWRRTSSTATTSTSTSRRAPSRRTVPRRASRSRPR